MGLSPTRPTCKVYAGTDPLTGREIRFRKTCKSARAARIDELLMPGNSIEVLEMLSMPGM